MINESVSMKGDVHITIYDLDGNVKREYDYPNLVVNTGKYHMAGRIANDSTDGAAISHMAIGTSTATPVITDTALISPLGPRSAAALSHVTGTNYLTITSNFPGVVYESTGVTEAGLFTASSGGLLVCRTTFGAFPITSAEVIGISWKITII